MAKARRMPTRSLVSASSNGRVGTVPLAFCRSKSGDSSIVVRAIPTLAARAAPTRNGIRHPHESRFAEVIELAVSKQTPTARSPPISLDAEAIDATKPRLGMSRQGGGAEHRQCHERYREQHRSPPPEPIPDMAKENAAERAQQIGDRECGQSCVERGAAGAKKDP